jgi:formylglycine-generating enzyme required for sulfatase activity
VTARRAPRVALLPLLAGLAAAPSCDRPATQVVVLLDSDMAAGVELRLVRVRLRRAGAPTWRYDRTFEVAPRAGRAPGTDNAAAGVQLPGEVAVDADDPGDPRPLEVEVAAFLRGDEGNFTQRVAVSFQRESVLYLTMFLAGRCRISANQLCPAGYVCGSAGCDRVADLVSSSAPADAGAARDAPAPPCDGGAAEACYDGVDNDCDGLVDEGCAPQSCARADLTTFAVTWPSGFDAAPYNSHCSSERLAPEGAFTLGDGADADPGGAEVAGVSVSPFRIDRYEVTVNRFARFVAAAMPRPPFGRVAYPGGALAAADLVPGGGAWPVRPPIEYSAANRFCHWSPGGGIDRDTQPVNCVDWFTAQAFCVWDGGRLPTEAEWEYAARYLPLPDAPPSSMLTSPRRYPWGGDVYNCDFNYEEPDCNGGGAGRMLAEMPYGTWAVTRTARTQPWYRVFDLAGNVAEWTGDVFAERGAGCWAAGARRADPLCATGTAPTLRFAVRGGGYRSLKPEVRGAARAAAAWDERDRTLGFRCVRSP